MPTVTLPDRIASDHTQSGAPSTLERTRIMFGALRQRLRTIAPELAGYLLILSVTLFSITYYFGEQLPNRWLVLALLFVFLVLEVASQAAFTASTSRATRHGFMLAKATIIVALMLIPPHFGFFPLLFFVLSAQAPLLFPLRVWQAYIVSFAALTGVIAFATDTEATQALASTLVYGGGYYFFASFAMATAKAQAAQAETQRLLAELQVANDQLQEYARQVETFAVVNERSRLAREMHDTLGHHLTVAAVQLEAADRLIGRDPERAHATIANAREQVNDALTELRRTVAALRAPVEEDLSLPQALTRLVEEFAQATSLDIDLQLPDALPELPSSHRRAIYRAAQESLTNVQRHAQATHVWVDLQCRANDIVLYVSDDGVGIPPHLEATGFGLRGLHERATQLGGEFYLTPRPGGGTQATLFIPLPKETSDADD